ncbi:MAG: site-2 protease family protein [Chloroflexia bacterium]|nr:site-2 protease family protein [Chloroflexia bacterium]
MRTSFRLGTLFGIPIRINYTWFLIFILVILSLAMSYFPNEAPGSSRLSYWIAGILASVLFFASVLAHELAHSLVARSRGVQVRDITLFLFGGAASIEQEMEQPQEELLMAGVGPLTSLFLGLIFALASWLLRPLSDLLGEFFSYLAVLNAGLAAFNLLPGLPLDGGRILRAIVWQISGNYRRATGVAATAGRIVSFLLIGGGILWTLTGNLSGLWIAFIGWFMENAATQSYRYAILQEALRGVSVAELLTPECARIPRGLSVAELVNRYIFPHGRRCFVVTNEDRLEGMLTVHNVRGLDRQEWPFTPVGQIMIPYQELLVAHPSEDAWEVLKRMDGGSVNQMPVEQDGQFLGLITRENLLRYVRLRAELGM